MLIGYRLAFAVRTDRTDKQIGRKKGDVLRVLTPEDLASSSILENAPLRDWPAVQTALKLLLRPAPAKWGITGSCGFSLAWGCSVMRASRRFGSWLWNASLPLDKDEMRDWLQSFRNLLVGIDVQISTPSGGFALREWLLRDAVLLKTNSGPVLTDKPWGDLS